MLMLRSRTLRPQRGHKGHLSLSNFPIGIIGILAILALAVLLSSNRKAIRLRVVGAAFALQAGIAFLVLYVPAGRAVISGMASGVSALLGYAQAGTNFIF